MMSGNLREVIEFLQPVETTNEYGEVETTYQSVLTVRASVESLVGSKVDTNNEIVQTYNVVFSTYYRYRSYVDEKYLIAWNGKNYRVTSLGGNSSDVRRNELRIVTEEVNE